MTHDAPTPTDNPPLATKNYDGGVAVEVRNCGRQHGDHKEGKYHLSFRDTDADECFAIICVTGRIAPTVEDAIRYADLKMRV